MRIALFTVVASLVCGTLLATPPFPPRVFSDDRFCYVIGFPWPDQDGKVLIIRTIRKTTLLSLQEIGIKEPIHTTAGIDWYREAVGYVGQFKALDDAVKWGFYFRGAGGYEFAISLPDGRIFDPELELDRTLLNAMTVKHAEKLASSGDSHNRKAAAIHLGELGGSSSIEVLKRLLGDDSLYTLHRSGDELKTVYYVREAAEAAISQIEERIAQTKMNKN